MLCSSLEVAGVYLYGILCIGRQQKPHGGRERDRGTRRLDILFLRGSACYCLLGLIGDSRECAERSRPFRSVQQGRSSHSNRTSWSGAPRVITYVGFINTQKEGRGTPGTATRYAARSLDSLQNAHVRMIFYGDSDQIKHASRHSFHSPEAGAKVSILA
eukprot:scaffold5340_cov257-Pinguiococcus_pyrenoidosus.AAC.4